MQVAAAILCDFASVRDNLLTVVGGGVTRLRRPSFPAPMEVALALMVELHRMEIGRPHELQILVQSQDGAELASILGAFNVGEADLEAGETLLVPFAFDLRVVEIHGPGPHSVEISVDGSHQRTIGFRALLSSGE